MREGMLSEVRACADQCALTGAASFFAGVPDAVTVVNGPLWCYYYAVRFLEPSMPLVSERLVCTNLANEAIVFGTEEDLSAALAPFSERPPALLAMVQSCSAGLIGDDVEGAARGMGFPSVASVSGGGLMGTFAAGWRRAADAALDVVLPEAAGRAEGARVNLIGATPAYYRGENDTRELSRLLALAGYEVNAAPGAGTSRAGLLGLGRAALNIVVHEELGRPMAERLRRALGTPFIAPRPPYGLAGTRRWLDAVHEALPAPRRAEALAALAAEEKRHFLRVGEAKMGWGELWFDEAVVVAPPSSAAGLSEALRGEWADMGRLTVVWSPEEEAPAAPPEAGIADALWTPARDGEAITRLFRTMPSGLVMASTNENSQCLHAAELEFVPVMYPAYERLVMTDEPMMGLRGAAHLLERLWDGHLSRAAAKGRRVRRR